MDKQQATEYIIARLQAGHQPEDITEELSRMLKAPLEKIRPFVDQVADEYSSMDAVVPAAAATIPAQTAPKIDIRPDQPGISNEELETQIDGLPPGLQALIHEDNAYITVSEPGSNHTHSGKPKGQEHPNTIEGALSEIELDELRKFTLQQLKWRQRHNDIVEKVCQKTGWHWNKSQRFVARLQTEHHNELQPWGNKATLIFCIGLIMVGLILAINGGVTVFGFYAKLAALSEVNPNARLQPPQSMGLALPAFYLGAGMLIGGGLGVIRWLAENYSSRD